jgi:hypothetical protein
MKIVLIIAGVLIAAFVAAQAYIRKNVSDTETQKYTVIKTFNDFEIRKYEPAVFTEVVMQGASYQRASGDGFRQLAGYIFGDNETGEKIAMTTPVEVEMSDTMKMKFMVPSAYRKEDLPAPANPQVKFVTEEAKVVAAVRFDGWATDEKIEAHIEMLQKALQSEGIAHKGNFKMRAYNPPFELTNRRNEVLVELIDYSAEN